MDDIDLRDLAVASLLAETPVTEDPAALERALLAYRRSHHRRRGQHSLSRHGMRIATVATVSVLTGSLAAGYAAALPDPVQRAVHHVLGHMGVPAPHHRDHPRPMPSRTPQQLIRHQQPRAALPLTHPLAPELQLADHGVQPAGAATAATIIVQQPAPSALVQMAPQPAGPWRTLLSEVPDSAGRITIRLPAFAHSVWVRAAAGNETGPPQRVVVIPHITARWSQSGSDALVLRLRVQGAVSGDPVTVTEISPRGLTQRRRAVLDAHGAASIRFAATPAVRTRLTASVTATALHGAATQALQAPVRS